MKTFGIYLIVLGHFFSVGNRYVYVFNVPLFFIISGFLCKRESDNKLFWQKITYNLLVPMFLISGVHIVCEFLFGGFDISRMLKNIVCMVIGLKVGLDECWFIYTLVLIRIIYQYIRSDVYNVLLIFLMLLLSYVYNGYEGGVAGVNIHAPNAWFVVLLAYPFYFIGAKIKTSKLLLLNLRTIFLAAIPCFLTVIACGYYNGKVVMYISDYGGYMTLFFAGALAGSFVVFCISKFFSKITPPIYSTYLKAPY